MTLYRSAAAFSLGPEGCRFAAALNPILMRLGDTGWLESRWQPSAQPGRPPRHLYRLTGAGAARARAALAADDAASPGALPEAGRA